MQGIYFLWFILLIGPKFRCSAASSQFNGQSNSVTHANNTAETRKKHANSSLIHSKLASSGLTNSESLDFKISLRTLSSGNPEEESKNIERNFGAVSARNHRVVAKMPLKRAGPSSRIVARCTGYWIEQGTSRDPSITFTSNALNVPNHNQEDIPFAKWFLHYFHQGTYQLYLSRNSPEGNAVVLVKKEKLEKNSHRILYQSCTRTVGMLIPSSHIIGKLLAKGNTFKRLLSFVDPLISAKSFQKCEANLHSVLCELQKLDSVHILEQTNFKIGVLNWQASNKNEEDLFSNNSISAVC